MNDKSLVELHLGTMAVSADQLTEVLQLCPNLKLLRHYQLVSALYKLHSEAWKSGSSLPRYKLTNLDADFSHVVGLCSLLLFVKKLYTILFSFFIRPYHPHIMLVQNIQCMVYWLLICMVIAIRKSALVQPFMLRVWSKSFVVKALSFEGKEIKC